MNWDREDCRMSRGVAAALFVSALLDPRLSRKQKDRMVEGWNKAVGKGKSK